MEREKNCSTLGIKGRIRRIYKVRGDRRREEIKNKQVKKEIQKKNERSKTDKRGN